MKKKKAVTSVSKELSVDKGSGSLAYNRLDMQVSQAVHMAIELFDDLEYLFILDYYDDIVLFDDERNPKVVSYYQMKTHEEAISISTAISEDWLSKLYLQLEKPDWIVKELGLVTNCPLKITLTKKNAEGKQQRQTNSYTSEKTAFSKFKIETIERIKMDIATKLKKDIKEIDLSKFVHMRTTLSIPRHRDIVEQEMGDFLNTRYPRITLDSVKAIFSSMLEILGKRQAYELLDEDASLSDVRKKKGLTKSEFNRIIDEAMIISIPPFADIYQIMGFSENEKYQGSFEYTRIMSDSQTKLESFTRVFSRVKKLCFEYRMDKSEVILQYTDRICDMLYSENCILESIYNRMYIRILIVCILINEGRRAL